MFGTDCWGGGMGMGMGIGAILWIVILVGVVWAVMKFSGGLTQKSPLDILKERYAKGEIDKAEFESRKKDLTETV